MMTVAFLYRINTDRRLKMQYRDAARYGTGNIRDVPGYRLIDVTRIDGGKKIL
jgi:hypothetical protein